MLFQKSTNKELEKILQRLKLNAENNYRDATLEDLGELEARFKELCDAGKMNEKQKTRYSGLISAYKTKLKGFTHKEQVAKW